MDFALNEEQLEFKAHCRRFASEVIRPVAAKHDAEESTPWEVIRAAREHGLHGLEHLQRMGSDPDGMLGVIYSEEMHWGCAGIALAISGSSLAAAGLAASGTPEQIARWVPECFGVGDEIKLGAYAVTEAQAGSDVKSMRTTARRDGDEWVLNGHKQWVTNFRNADVVLTYARTPGEADDADASGITVFLVPADAFEVDHVWDTLGARSVKSPRVTLSNVAVPDGAVVGEVGRALEQRGKVSTGVNVPARAVGIARAALEDTVAYTSGREQYGHPIGDFQGVEWTAGEMATRVETARLLTLRAADLADRGRDTTRTFAMAKVQATEAAVATANDAVQLHGGVGYTRDRDVERYLRDARLLTIAGGPNEGHKDTLGAATYADYGESAER